ncbi:hypothetical protein B0T22DRAFT_492804 [Podospora appendiculata]|uniref:Inactive metallocarboxypeptidase ECM14 n=1 Tax=Podospora appendiculata TaxID=314037 RepID=A0AAE0X6T3_9PEZI|nr:hypothetical protein B0T22DRAFT_492804 [Podospora appendiculata]
MQLSFSLRRNLVAISAVLLLAAVAFPAAVDAAVDRSGHGPSPHHADCDGHVFPFLKWLRDSAAEVIFGKPSSARGSKDTKPSQAGALQHRYRNDVVLRFNVSTSDEEGALAKAAQQLLLDVWALTPEFVDIRIQKDYIPPLLSLLPTSLQPSVLIPDVGAAVWATYPSKKAAAKTRFDSNMVVDPVESRKLVDGVDNLFFSDYQTLPVITNWMRLLEAMFPDITEMITIGKSYEGRDILALRVGQHSGSNSTETRKTILITGGVHGREWISTSTVSYLLWSIITAYGKEPMITKLLEQFDIVFVPVVNPDGYAYTWQTDRLWRKSRQQTKMRFCRGLDLDHAFGYEWEAANHQTDPCSESYGGDSPFQAVEASELAAWAKNETENNVKFVGFLDLHSYSQQILYPFSFTCDIDPPNRENLEELAVGLAKAIRLSSGESYSVTSACEGAVPQTNDAGQGPRIESGGGSAIDWFYHELKAKYSYQIKLRDTGSYGFLLPSEHIVPTGEEMLNALKYFGDFLLGNNGIEKSLSQQDTSNKDEWKELRRRKR